jgi:DMSO/TMAO reductase YedYZ molybdopterin-dependent catalytic subunit
MADAKQARFRSPAAEGPPPAGEAYYREEIQLALRNRGMPLEALRYDVTPDGLHYLLTHFDIPYIDADAWALSVSGLVNSPLRLDLASVRALPSRTLTVTLECAGNGRALMRDRAISQPWLVEAVSTASWTGARLQDVLTQAGVRDGAVELLFRGADEGIQGEEVQFYERSLSLADALHDDVLLAYEMNGRPLPPQHGYPLRLIVPGWYGMTSVKWLTQIEVLDHAFEGYQMVHSYRYSQSEDEAGEAVNLIRVRALMVPPGIPDFMTRTRLLGAGPVRLEGRAWAGRRAISRVEVSADGGQSWLEAALQEPASPYAWWSWTCDWQARPGRYELWVRATDAAGAVQPIEQWNYYGMGNNMVQRVEVIVE